MGKVKPEDCFSERELMDYKEAFTVIDKDGDGEISVKELKACYNELGLFLCL
jgi:Ca2+-binding EF-hand superfamily protein